MPHPIILVRIGITSKQAHANFVNFHSLQRYIAQIFAKIYMMIDYVECCWILLWARPRSDI